MRLARYAPGKAVVCAAAFFISAPAVADDASTCLHMAASPCDLAALIRLQPEDGPPVRRFGARIDAIAPEAQAVCAQALEQTAGHDPAILDAAGRADLAAGDIVRGIERVCEAGQVGYAPALYDIAQLSKALEPLGMLMRDVMPSLARTMMRAIAAERRREVAYALSSFYAPDHPLMAEALALAEGSSAQAAATAGLKAVLSKLDAGESVAPEIAHRYSVSVGSIWEPSPDTRRAMFYAAQEGALKAKIDFVVMATVEFGTFSSLPGVKADATTLRVDADQPGAAIRASHFICTESHDDRDAFFASLCIHRPEQAELDRLMDFVTAPMQCLPAAARDYLMESLPAQAE